MESTKRAEQSAAHDDRRLPEGAASLVETVQASLEDDKAENISVINLVGKSSVADAMVVASGRSHRHVGALADHLLEKIKELGQPILSLEGKEAGDWVLIDLGDVVVHIFRPEVREYYQIEKLWSVRPEPGEPPVH